MNEKEFIELHDSIVAQVAPLPEFEYRLYYDDEGNVIDYSYLPGVKGASIIIDKQTFLERRTDLKVINESIVYMCDFTSYTKLVPSDQGTGCHPDNALLVDNESTKYWEVKTFTVE